MRTSSVKRAWVMPIVRSPSPRRTPAPITAPPRATPSPGPVRTAPAVPAIPSPAEPRVVPIIKKVIVERTADEYAKTWRMETNQQRSAFTRRIIVRSIIFGTGHRVIDTVRTPVIAIYIPISIAIRSSPCLILRYFTVRTRRYRRRRPFRLIFSFILLNILRGHKVHVVLSKGRTSPAYRQQQNC